MKDEIYKKQVGGNHYRYMVIQPSEFIIGQDNNIIVSSYSDGPLGRMDATDVIKLANFFTSRE